MSRFATLSKPTSAADTHQPKSSAEGKTFAELLSVSEPITVQSITSTSTPKSRPQRISLNAFKKASPTTPKDVPTFSDPAFTTTKPGLTYAAQLEKPSSRPPTRVSQTKPRTPKSATVGKKPVFQAEPVKIMGLSEQDIRAAPSLPTKTAVKQDLSHIDAKLIEQASAFKERASKQVVIVDTTESIERRKRLIEQAYLESEHASDDDVDYDDHIDAVYEKSVQTTPFTRPQSRQ
jgi:hypothetical protein